MSKFIRLQKMLTSSGKLTIAALDHRGLLKIMLHPEDPESTSNEEITQWKELMVSSYRERVSCLLIDPVYGEQLVDINAKCGWIMSLEQTGYRGGQEARVTELIPGWDVKKIKQAGAVGVKLLLYYDPENVELARRQRELASKVGKECEREQMVFLLEPLTYKKSRDPYIVERMVDELINLPVDIFKLEYPGSLEKCQRISQKLAVPWVLLSAGADYDVYKQELETACRAGASGMAVGRAAWQEFGRYEGGKREEFLKTIAVERIVELGKIVEQYAKPVATT